MKKWNLQLSKFKGKYLVYLANTCANSIVKIKCYSEVSMLHAFMTNLVARSSNIRALFGTSNAFEVSVGNMSIHVDSIASKVKPTSLVDNVNINQDGGTSAVFDMNDKVKVRENPDVVGDNLVPKTESKENRGRIQRNLTKKGKEYKISLLESRKQRLYNQLMRKC